MEVFAEYLANIDNKEQLARTKDVLDWVKAKFAWNQPMFTDHGTFIIGFSIAKLHMAISPERQGMEHFVMQLQHQTLYFDFSLLQKQS